MSNDLETPLQPSPSHPDEFVVYHYINPETDCEYAYLATNADRSVLLSLGDLSLGFDFELPDDADRWLTQDYTPTPERLHLNLTQVRYLIEQTFAGGALFGFVNYDDDLAIRSLELSLRAQEHAASGTEYVVHALGDYQRWYREPDVRHPVTLAERAMLDVCCSTFQTLSQDCPYLLTAPPTPWFKDALEPDLPQ